MVDYDASFTDEDGNTYDCYARLCDRCRCVLPDNWEYAWCEKCGKECPHGNPPAECNECMISSDIAFDADREQRHFGRTKGRD